MSSSAFVDRACAGGRAGALTERPGPAAIRGAPASAIVMFEGTGSRSAAGDAPTAAGDDGPVEGAGNRTAGIEAGVGESAATGAKKTGAAGLDDGAAAAGNSLGPRRESPNAVAPPTTTARAPIHTSARIRDADVPSALARPDVESHADGAEVTWDEVRGLGSVVSEMTAPISSERRSKEDEDGDRRGACSGAKGSSARASAAASA